jgi:hypothetical protein
MAGQNMATESEKVVHLAGTKQNPARDPKLMKKGAPGSMGDVALKDAIVIVVLAWLVLIFLAFSLRQHNI